MIHWNRQPLDELRRYEIFGMHGSTPTEFGIRVILSRMCEFAIMRSEQAINRSTEKIEMTWICVDHFMPGRVRAVDKCLLSVPIYTEFLTIYPPVPSGPPRLNPLFSFGIDIVFPQKCPYYTDDRPVFAERMLHTIHECWNESWDLWSKVAQAVHPMPRWPVKLWIHGQPNCVWQIVDDGRLAVVDGHPLVDESVIEMNLENRSRYDSEEDKKNHDLRRLSLMMSSLGAFMRGELQSRSLITDLDALFKSLKVIDSRWKEDFWSEWSSMKTGSADLDPSDNNALPTLNENHFSGPIERLKILVKSRIDTLSRSTTLSPETLLLKGPRSIPPPGGL